MSDDLKVDWGKPIEAVHEDGRVVAVALYEAECQPDEEGDYEIYPPREVPTAYFREDGWPSPNGGGQGCRWRIRNVTLTQQDATSGEVACPTGAENARVEPGQFAESAKIIRATVNAVFAENINDQASRLGVRPVETESPGWWQQRVRKAAVLAALLPEPVDADEQYARDLIREQGWLGVGEIGGQAVLHMIAKAHREGRALERDSREG